MEAAASINSAIYRIENDPNGDRKKQELVKLTDKISNAYLSMLPNCREVGIFSFGNDFKFIDINNQNKRTGIKLASTEPSNPKGMYAGLYFGGSTLKFNSGSDPITLTEIGFSRINDSIVKIPNGVKATVDPAAESSSLNLDAGFYLGYFPKLLTFSLPDNQVIAAGAMTNLGVSFRNGFGAWLGIGPEIAYRKDAWSLHLGYLFSFHSMDRKLGTLRLEGADNIVIQEEFGLNKKPEWETESAQWRRHDTNSELFVLGSATSQSPYLRLGYNWGGENKSGVGLVIGYRTANNNAVEYELRGKVEKVSSEHKSPLNGKEFQNLGNALDFGGLYVQLELFTVPF
jgi:hypothetical protein